VRGQTADFDLLSLSRDRRLVRTQAAIAVRALARAVDFKDAATREHSERVAEVAGHLAEILKWSPQRIERLRQAALVHDVGKISIPDTVLFKPDALSEREYELVKTHTTLGAAIVAEALDDEQVHWVRSHHERDDGTGYPASLSGEAIPDGARILAVADAWDAMTSDRPYQSERTPAAALEECRRCAGSHFSPEVVAAFSDPAFARFARILANERAARDANAEHVEATNAHDRPTHVVDLRCECFDADCEGMIPVELRELGTVRAHQRRFILLPGHEKLEAERVILRTERFLVVDKRM